MEAIRPASLEFLMRSAAHPAEHRRDPPARPAERVLNLRKRTRPIGTGGELAEQLAHQLAAAVVEALDLLGLVHRVGRCVLGTCTPVRLAAPPPRAQRPGARPPGSSAVEGTTPTTAAPAAWYADDPRRDLVAEPIAHT